MFSGLGWAGLGFHPGKRFGFVGGWIFGWVIQLVGWVSSLGWVCITW